MKKLYLISLLLIFCVQAFAQDVFQGVVKSEENEPLLRAAVKVFDANENLLATTFTDAEGKFVTDIEMGRVTGIEDPWSGNHYLSLIYPNPASKGPVHFKYRSVTGEQPLIAFYTFKGELIQAGTTISAGTYIYKATFAGTEKKISTGLFSVLSSMKLEVHLQEISQKQNNKTASSKNISAARVTAAEQVRIEIEKDGYITLSKEVDLSDTENGNQTYSLNPADKPSAAFQIIADDGQNAGDLIKFDASASAGANQEALTYSWSFSDGSRGGQVQIPHIFTTADTYSVTLTVVGAYGAKQSITKDITIAAKTSPTGIAAIRGIVSDAQGNPLEGVSVQVPHMDTTFVTTSGGEVGFDGFISGQPRMIILSKPGYVSEHYPLDILADSRQGYFELSLINQEPAIVIDNAELGGVAAGKDGGTVQLPVEGLMHGDGSIVTGEVQVYVTPIDISDDQALDAFPGNFAGITFEGAAPLIMTYGTADYTFMQNGEELQLVPGKTATVEIPIYADVDELGESLSEGDEFPLWYYAEASGNWINEGNGVVVASNESPTGLALRGEVTHFSWWNHDIAPSPWWAVPECKIIDQNGLPTLALPNGGACYIKGEIEGPAGPRGNPSTPNCCAPLPSPLGVPIIFHGTGGNGIYSGSVIASGDAGTTSNLIIPMKRMAGYGKIAGIIAPDTLFNTAIETADNIDAFTIKGTGHVGEEMLLFVGQASGSNLEGAVELRDPDNLLLYKGGFASGKSVQTLVEIKKEGDYQVIVSGTANAPGAYTVSLTATELIKLNTNTNSEWAFQKEIKTFIVDLKKDQLFSAALATEEASGKFFMRVYDPTEKSIFSSNSQGYVQTPIFKSALEGIYRIEVEGIADNLNKFVLGLSSIKDPQVITLDGVLTNATDSMKILGERKYYKIEGTVGERRQFTIHTWELSTIMKILKPGEKPFYERNYLTNASTSNYNSDGNGPYSWGGTPITTLPESGEYIIEVNGTMGYNVASVNWKYELFINKPDTKPIALNSQITDETVAFFDWINEFKHYTFDGTAGDLVNVGYLEAASNGSYLRLFDPEMKEISSVRHGRELGVVALPTTGKYTIEYVGVDRDRSQGKFILGLTSVEPPVVINYQTPFTTINGVIDVVGKHHYYSLQVDSLERFNIGIALSDTSQAAVAFRKSVNDKPFYNGPSFHSTISEKEGDFKETNVIAMPHTGEIVLGISSILYNDMKLDDGAYTLYLGQPEVRPLALNTPVVVDVKMDLGKYNPFYRYKISSPASNKIKVSAKANPPRSLSDRSYISVQTLDGVVIKRELATETSVITLPGAGEYIVEIESVYNYEVEYTHLVTEQP